MCGGSEPEGDSYHFGKGIQDNGYEFLSMLGYKLEER